MFKSYVCADLYAVLGLVSGSIIGCVLISMRIDFIRFRSRSIDVISSTFVLSPWLTENNFLWMVGSKNRLGGSTGPIDMSIAPEEEEGESRIKYVRRTRMGRLKSCQFANLK